MYVSDFHFLTRHYLCLMSSHPSVLLASDSSGKKRKASDDIPVLNDDELESIWEEALIISGPCEATIDI